MLRLPLVRKDKRLFIFSTNKMRSAIADERKTDEKDLF
jgi:hypothetical protein